MIATALFLVSISFTTAAFIAMNRGAWSSYYLFLGVATLLNVAGWCVLLGGIGA